VFGILSFASADQMTNSSFRKSSAVISCDGAFTSSTNYQINGNLGQPAPLMEPLDPPFTDNYDLYPGFWYTLAYHEVPKRAMSVPLILLLLNE